MNHLRNSASAEIASIIEERNSFREKATQAIEDLRSIKEQQSVLEANQKNERETNASRQRDLQSDLNRYKLSDSKLSSENILFSGINARLEDQVIELEKELLSTRMDFEQTLNTVAAKHLQSVEDLKSQHAQSTRKLVDLNASQSRELSSKSSELAALKIEMTNVKLEIDRESYVEIKRIREEEDSKHSSSTKELLQRIAVLTETQDESEHRCLEYLKEIEALRSEHKVRKSYSCFSLYNAYSSLPLPCFSLPLRLTLRPTFSPFLFSFSLFLFSSPFFFFSSSLLFFFSSSLLFSLPLPLVSGSNRETSTAHTNVSRRGRSAPHNCGCSAS